MRPRGGRGAPIAAVPGAGSRIPYEPTSENPERSCDPNPSERRHNVLRTNVRLCSPCFPCLGGTGSGSPHRCRRGDAPGRLNSNSPLVRHELYDVREESPASGS
ncbi:protein of unknown function [Candidatus Hydrogenisulfobacillus filiaventi]|uniref:Uncharacterized protein n=1 Tax=Candidatus Hydrogenisulfobacillus filiaventi TaxID=2707344 RepID=A0A6F8ZDS9_9FIRM|nr:protein of unknown function [Candidatus Hydrogenisulfobacillus filiaventi]